ncbi:MAG TPA: Trp biosynthesis-associated membrane protein [Pseudonocardia sp.]
MTRTPTRNPRTLLVACAGLAGSAVLLWGASATVWFRIAGPPGRSATESTGAQVAPSLTGVALLALAAIAAVVATGGPLRRAVGALLALVGIVVGVVVVQSVVAPPAGQIARTAAPLLAVAGAVVLLLVGVFVLLREPRFPRFGARYAAPGARPVETDPDRAAWQALDAGVDPTADVPGSRGDDPGDGGRTRPG